MTKQWLRFLAARSRSLIDPDQMSLGADDIEFLIWISALRPQAGFGWESYAGQEERTRFGRLRWAMRNLLDDGGKIVPVLRWFILPMPHANDAGMQ